VLIDDGVVQTFSVTNLNLDIVWTHFTMTFQATGASTTVEFRSLDARRTSVSLLDNVRGE